jgi:pimeloyl-ACP methyl ester carboxylesterase
MKPKLRYARSGTVNIAYQVVGKGPVDLVYVPGWVSHIDMMWDDPKKAAFLESLASFSRLILFDKRGTGLSDRISGVATLEERMDDISSVMEAVSSEKAVLFGHSEGGTVSALFAATYPQRTIALITFGIFARRKPGEDYPWAPSAKDRERFYRAIEESWGDAENMGLEQIMPSMADNKAYYEWFTRYLCSAASPGAALALARMNTEADIRNILSTIIVPTLVINRVGDRDAKVEEARYIANRIPDAKLVELPGYDHLFWVGDTYGVLAEIEEFITGVRPNRTFNRVLATILMTDIVNSTSHLSRIGDNKWIEVLERHNYVVRHNIAVFNGREIKSTGDGFLIVFDGPSKAVRCAEAIRAEVRNLPFAITAAVHIGECEQVDEDDIGGIAVHVAARVLGVAEPGQILITMTVKHLLGGTGLEFKNLGEFDLRGIEEAYQLYELNMAK